VPDALKQVRKNGPKLLRELIQGNHDKNDAPRETAVSDIISSRLSSNLRSDDDEYNGVLGRQTRRVSMSHAPASYPSLLGSGGEVLVPIGSFLPSDNYPGISLLDNIGIFLSASQNVSLHFTGATMSTRISPLMCDSRGCLACCIVHFMDLERVQRDVHQSDSQAGDAESVRPVN
jgi:hypothetical protein